MRKQAAPLTLSLCPSSQRWLGTSRASWLLWKWLRLLWPRFVSSGRGPGGAGRDLDHDLNDWCLCGCRRRKLAGSRTPWTCTSTAWGSCCCCWQVRPAPPHSLPPCGPALSTRLPLSAGEPPGRRRELLHTEVPTVVGWVVGASSSPLTLLPSGRTSLGSLGVF